MAASTTLGRPLLFTQMSPSLQASLLAPTIPVAPPQLANLQRHVRGLQQASGFTDNPRSESSHPSTLYPPPPPPPPILNPSVDPATLGRIKDLEAQVQSLKSENEQQVCLNGRSFAYGAGLNAFICSAFQRVQLRKT